MILNSLLLCSCPLSAAIPTIDASSGCIERFGQIQRIILQRTFSTGSTLNTIPVASVELLATWTALKAATDGTKIQMTPRFGNPTHEAAAPRRAGGGNQTPGGVEIILGSSASPFTAEFQDLPQSQAKAIKSFRCEDGLSLFLVNEAGQIGCIADDNESISTLRGIPVRSFFVGDKVFGNYENYDMNPIEWQFEPDWSENFTVISPQFNPHTALI